MDRDTDTGLCGSNVAGCPLQEALFSSLSLFGLPTFAFILSVSAPSVCVCVTVVGRVHWHYNYNWAGNRRMQLATGNWQQAARATLNWLLIVIAIVAIFADIGASNAPENNCKISGTLIEMYRANKFACECCKMIQSSFH